MWSPNCISCFLPESAHRCPHWFRNQEYWRWAGTTLERFPCLQAHLAPLSGHPDPLQGCTWTLWPYMLLHLQGLRSEKQAYYWLGRKMQEGKPNHLLSTFTSKIFFIHLNKRLQYYLLSDLPISTYIISFYPSFPTLRPLPNSRYIHIFLPLSIQKGCFFFSPYFP